MGQDLPTWSRAGRSTVKVQPIDRFLAFPNKTDKKTDQLSVTTNRWKKQISQNDQANFDFQTFIKENCYFQDVFEIIIAYNATNITYDGGVVLFLAPFGKS